jgi:uracil-DNA glycosylase
MGLEDMLNNDICNCSKCPLVKDMPFGSPVPGVGPSEARIMLIGEALGKDEAALAEPFVGQCGQLLDKMLLDAGLDRSRLFITNAVKCRPTKNEGKANRPPSDVEIAACKGWLWKEIQLVKPKCIITLGKVPTYTLLRSQLKKSYKLGSIVGVEFIVDFCDSRIFPTYHPSFLMLHGKDKVEETVNLFKELKIRFG